jgi:hypothetical protein
MGAAGKSRRALLQVAAARVSVERHCDRDDDRGGHGEQHDGGPDDRNADRTIVVGPQLTLHKSLI